MGQGRKVTISEFAVEKIAETAWFIESKNSTAIAKKFVDSVFEAMFNLSNPIVRHHRCHYSEWKDAGYLCFNFKKKYVIAYYDWEEEIVVCDFSHSALLV